MEDIASYLLYWWTPCWKEVEYMEERFISQNQENQEKEEFME